MDAAVRQWPLATWHTKCETDANYKRLLDYCLTPQRLDIGELRLNGLDTKLIINKDKSINLMRVLKPAAGTIAWQFLALKRLA